MSFLDIKDPKERDKIVADYVATIRRVQQRNEVEKSAGLAKQAELEQTFSPIVKATEKSTETITKQLVPLHEKPTPRKKQTTWDEHSDQPAIEYYLKSYNKSNLDKYFGIQLDENNGEYVLGTKAVMMDEKSNIYVDDHTYEGTPGLWRLIMVTHPSEFSENDLKNYKELMNRTEAKTNPNNVGYGRPTATAKWKLLEKILPEKEEKGSGIFLPGDIKGLTTKLNLLLAEFRAGNKSTRNEIVFILDELLRRKRMTRKEYTEINNYITKK